jgi:hypothetical protein
MLRIVRPVIEVRFLVAAVNGRRESVVGVHNGLDEYHRFGALRASCRSLLVLTTNDRAEVSRRNTFGRSA